MSAEGMRRVARWALVCSGLCIAVVLGCRAFDTPGGGQGVLPFVTMRDQPIPDTGVLTVQFQAEANVHLYIEVDGPFDTAPEFKLSVGALDAGDFDSAEGVEENSKTRRPGFAGGGVITEVQGFYTLFVTDANNVSGVEFDITIS